MGRSLFMCLKAGHLILTPPLLNSMHGYREERHIENCRRVTYDRHGFVGRCYRYINTLTFFMLQKQG